MNKSGEPAHPLYLKADLKPLPIGNLTLCGTEIKYYPLLNSSQSDTLAKIPYTEIISYDSDVHIGVYQP